MVCLFASTELVAETFVWPFREMLITTCRRLTRTSSLTTFSASLGWMCSSTSALKTKSNELSAKGRFVRMPCSTQPFSRRSGHSCRSTAPLSSIL